MLPSQYRFVEGAPLNELHWSGRLNEACAQAKLSFKAELPVSPLKPQQTFESNFDVQLKDFRIFEIPEFLFDTRKASFEIQTSRGDSN